MINLISSLLIICGIAFFVSGTVGLLRFPDLYTRLHALTKADNMGLGLILMGLAIQADTIYQSLFLIVIWLLVLTASTLGSFLLAQQAHKRGVIPWSKH